MLSVKEIALRLSVSESTVRRLLANGELNAIRVGKQWRFQPDTVQNINNNGKHV